MKTIRVLLIEDNRILRDGIAAMITGASDYFADSRRLEQQGNRPAA
jgi:hypothetical protein